MAFTFKVGQRYRNRDGEYEVIALNGDMMTIRYTDGRTINSEVAWQSRIWERIREEEGSGAEELELDGKSDNGESRQTEEIGELVIQVLRAMRQPWPPDVTDQVCLNIERRKDWFAHYQQLEKEFGKLTVNTSIGAYVKEITGMENTGRTAIAKSDLIQSYSVLAPGRLATNDVSQPPEKRKSRYNRR